MNLAFSDALIAPILAGTKVHAFRASHRWRGEMLIHLYARNQRPEMRLFFPAQLVVSVPSAVFDEMDLHIAGRRLKGVELVAFAHRDDFPDAAALFIVFTGWPKPIIGPLIHWTPLHYPRLLPVG